MTETGPGAAALVSPVPPGSGWPEDPASPATPVARDAGQVRDLAAGADSLAELVARQSVCRACPRLVAWREQVAAVKRASTRTETYWGRPIHGWGDDHPAVLIVGLAPAAHGGNRTGRVFTGDRSGDVLFASLYRCGLAAQPTSVTAGDGQRLIGGRMVAAVRCAPPENKPTVTERDTCAPWLASEFAFIAGSVKVIVCLGGFAWQAAWTMLRSAGFTLPRPRPAFGHAAEVILAAPTSAGAPSTAGAPGAPDIPCTAGTSGPAGTPHLAGTPSPANTSNPASNLCPAGILRPSGTSGPAGPPGPPGTAGPGDPPGPPDQPSHPSSSGPPSLASPSGPSNVQAPPNDRGQLLLLGCYHPSQQNTFTGRVTPQMLDAVFRRAAEAAGLPAR